MLDKDNLVKVFPALARNANTDKLVNILNIEMQIGGIITTNRIAGFVAQCGHESGGFTRFVENLNYSSEGLMKTFPKYFPTKDLADQYARQPEKIANKVYANRMGNGPEESGDGWKFRGRGLIQLTGFTNYYTCDKVIKKDLAIKPEYLETLEGAVKSAVWYWTYRNLNECCDQDDVVTMTKKINGGTLGLSERTHLYNLGKELF